MRGGTRASARSRSTSGPSRPRPSTCCSAPGHCTGARPDVAEPTDVSPATLPSHVAANREAWDGFAAEYVAAAEREWALRPGDETWGLYGIPETQVGMLDLPLDGADAIELGCGTAYVSAWLARRGARPVGLDNSPRQLETASRMQREHGLEFPLLLGSAEEVPLPDASFDVA